MSQSQQLEGGAASCPVLQPLGPRRLATPIRICRPVCVVGSHPRVHLPLPSEKVSRSHALIVVDGTSPYVRDLSSSNGIFVNGDSVCESRLRHRDVLTIRPWSFRWLAPLPPGHRPRKLAQVLAAGEFSLQLIDHASPCAIRRHTALIGQRAGCDLVIAHESVSPVHAVIFRRGAAHYLRDLNSHTGTFINGRCVREVELRSGDEIRIGQSLICFRAVEPQPSQASGFDLDRIVGPAQAATEREGLAGFAGMSNSDVRRQQVAAPAPAPTIAELLGAEPEPLTLPSLRPRQQDEILAWNDCDDLAAVFR